MARYIAVVDYHKGNLMSVERGLLSSGAEVRVTDDPSVIAAACGAVVPGVGAFADAMEYMVSSGQADALRDLACSRRPLLGICLGMQLLFERGNEHAAAPAPGTVDPWVAGFALLPGEVRRLAGEGVKVPHVGWNSVDYTAHAKGCPLFTGIDDGSHFYFTHSYACLPGDGDCCVATTEHGGRFASAVWDGAQTFGVQFHPEKSSETGHRLLANFVRIVQGGAR